MVTVGLGLTVTVAVIGVPVQVTPALVRLGVIVKVTVIGELVVLVSVPTIGLAVPLAAMPCTLPLAASPLSLVQLYIVLPLFPDKAMLIAEPEQMVCDAGVATAVGMVLTVTVNGCAVPGQLNSLVTVIVPV